MRVASNLYATTNAHAHVCAHHAVQLKLVPHLQPEDQPCHFDGSLEQAQSQRQGGDVECVAYFDGNEWTLQLVQAHLRAK